MWASIAYTQEQDAVWIVMQDIAQNSIHILHSDGRDTLDLGIHPVRSTNVYMLTAARGGLFLGVENEFNTPLVEFIPGHAAHELHYDWAGESPKITLRLARSITTDFASHPPLLKNRTTGQTFADADLTYSVDAAGTVSLARTGGQPLPDGNYTFTLAPGTLTDGSGESNRTAIDLDFFVLAGDVDHDRDVDFDDLLVIAQHYGQAGRTFAEGNVNYSADGRVDFDDLLLVAQKYGQSLAALIAVPARPAARPAVQRPTSGRALAGLE